MRNLAKVLLAAESATGTAAQSANYRALSVCEKMRHSLTRFAGSEGFTALLRRALSLARTQFPALEATRVKQDGSISGLEDIPIEATVALIAHMLALLIIFIGEPLTLRLLEDAWPELSTTCKSIGIGI